MLPLANNGALQYSSGHLPTIKTKLDSSIEMSDKKIAHMVYFTLENPSDENIQHMLNEMNQFLNDHPGLEYFSCGTLNAELSRPVNDRSYHVSLHTVFANRAAHDAYQIHTRHQEFINRNKSTWKLVRVFDSDC